jgi:hypothetical protein
MRPFFIVLLFKVLSILPDYITNEIPMEINDIISSIIIAVL